ncbi:MAG TPA: cytochrome c oxidase assembly protein [Halieaceae bacterium]|jgi:cytochrome c oxidase assembly protein subunit 11|uniref:cytochrome c oxidase assembly protein n=1 Tax=Haliea TaxID=475794 RepID=UPI000C63BFC1|nr:cytochrome c oxidase assembly protein [Haliea sp.]HBM82556.1 cytochrome c oxidase assembly protein [Halieaceae bacterium]MAD63617.1 cytochrome c oxidase assembly protein [Haliea sp.]MAY91978.1 cytochrome c oxidase assembly protein [Haliea sp.]MBK41902.1 cytochrome c oxidase assembly protein [Haliea sp.]MBP69920.1 cytochrome c oxidase assembly protein [Haliea sp.]|tara:strand:+ start:2558 stop:3118 length:561 start_codon:yes stop_codon:yes gene_type:complete
MLRVSSNPVVDTVVKLVSTAVIMFAFVFVVMVPLYNVLCDALGINGKTNGEAYTSVQAGVDESRTVTIQFVATNNEGMPWDFGPSVTMMKVHPGASNDTVFHARNPLPQAMVAQAIPSVSPSRAAAYFHKTECFCFNQQPLDGDSSAEMPLQFIIDRDLPSDIHTITLSYTIFDVTDMVGGSIAAR